MVRTAQRPAAGPKPKKPSGKACVPLVIDDTDDLVALGLRGIDSRHERLTHGASPGEDLCRNDAVDDDRSGIRMVVSVGELASFDDAGPHRRKVSGQNDVHRRLAEFRWIRQSFFGAIARVGVAAIERQRIRAGGVDHSGQRLEPLVHVPHERLTRLRIR